MGVRLRDNEIRAAVHATLLRHARTCADTIVIDELGLDHGACRVDIAIINGHIRGVEIKGDADVLAGCRAKLLPMARWSIARR